MRESDLELPSRSSRRRKTPVPPVSKARKILATPPPTTSRPEPLTTTPTPPPTDNPLRSLLRALKAVRAGDFTTRLSADEEGVFGDIAEAFNDIVEMNENMAKEFFRVSRIVGQEGRMTERASIGPVRGSWALSLESVNSLIGDLVQPTNEAARVLTSVAKGDLSQKMSLEIDGRPLKGEFLRIGTTVNGMVDQLGSFASEVIRVAKEVGTEGKLGGKAEITGASGVWRDLTDNVNQLAGNLTDQVRNIAKVTTAVAKGDLSQKITVDAKGEVLELKNTINTMVDQLSSFAAEVTRVAKEVGTEGKLGGQANVKGVSGTWKDLTDNVNFMAGNLTKQVRGIVKVVTAVANGDLNQKFVLEAQGEVAALADTINDMIDTLRTFADQVTSVAREVGIEGKLGGQAKVPGASGIWKDLTDNVNQLADNLTSQVRAIAEVSTAVTKGDLTRSITVAAQGEVAELKDNINQMIANLRETTEKNTEQDWLKTNLAKFTEMMQGQRSLTSVAQLIMSELTPLVDAQLGTFYILDNDGNESVLSLIASYAYSERKQLSKRFRLKEGLVGQCAFEKKRILLSRVPESYLPIRSSLGESSPTNVIVLPVLFEGELKAVIELAAFLPFKPNHLNFLDQLMDSIGVILNMIASSMRTEELLQELKRSNAELEAQANELEEKAKLLELKNQEVELASQSLEEKAEQLSLISKYKSEFLANMSHELRTPLNSLLILSKMLSDNKDKNLTSDQVKYASTIYSAGCDLLGLINEILDLSKVEAGKMPIDPRDVDLQEVKEYLEQTFSPVAEHKALGFSIDVSPGVPKRLFTDTNRLQQILKNLLSNAFKFTSEGSVSMKVSLADPAWSSSRPLPQGGVWLAFSVKDTGVGIPKEKQQLIFEAFQQADGTTSRKYGGTGLGLTISREIARLLGGSIEVESTPGKGSTFTLCLPERYVVTHTVPESRPLEVSPPLPPLPEGADFSGRKVLVVDDDMRNVFAITSILESRGMEVIYAENGKAGIELLDANPDVDLVLMDTMMPEMDGLEAISRIRTRQSFRDLPIISLTAKAMKGNREECLRAGASDYVVKPVDPEKLLSVMHAWLGKEGAPAHA